MQLIDALLSLETSHASQDRSLSPMYSNFGLCFDARTAGPDLLLHYNRKTRAVFSPVFSFAAPCKADATFLSAAFTGGGGTYELCFYGTDAFVLKGEFASPVRAFSTAACETPRFWQACGAEDLLILQGYSENGDDRDPDKYVPVLCGVRVLRGTLREDAGGALLLPDAAGRLYFAAAFEVLDISAERLKQTLLAAPADIDGAKRAMRRWATDCAGGLRRTPAEPDARQTFLTAVSGLLMNLTKAPGSLSLCVSAFPSRGGYPTHFMWDSAFQNLAYELMSEKTAADSLLQLAYAIRPDGKIPQFLCSTWARPHYAQPALLGWAAQRYVARVGARKADEGFIRTVADALAKNNEWWLTQRITRSGLICCPDGLETGQDDSPRFDHGPVLAVDMNAYLLRQMRATAYFCRLAGDGAGAAAWEARAEAFASLMVTVLYDENRNLFFDADPETGERRTLVTLSSLIPLWAGVPLPEAKIRAMIGDYLLNEAYFFGEVPFPCVAYNEPVYEPAQWWRGPTWMPVAWLMLELLEDRGYADARAEAARRLYRVMKKDAVLHELFDSSTGEGLGCDEQGWTAAIFIRLSQESEGCGNENGR